MKKSTLLLPLFTAAALLAQSGTAPNTQGQSAHESGSAHGGPKSGRHRGIARLSRQLNLTPEQGMQVRGFFRQANEEAMPIRKQLHQQQASLAAAIKANSEQQIDQITHQSADLSAQLQAIRAKTMARVFSILNPDQQTKFDMMHSQAERFGRHAKRNG